jgi:hypothetical protein
MNIILKYLLGNPQLRSYVPYSVRRKLKGIFEMSDYNKAVFESLNPYVGTSVEWEYRGETDYKIGIIYDIAHYHRYFQSACLDMRISYKVIDIRRNDWHESIKASKIAGIVAWPSLTTAVLKEMLDERSRLIRDSLGIKMMPSPEEVFLLDNKRRVRDWILVNGFKPPETWCFYTKDEALAFVNNTALPIVFKSTKEGVSRGVVICRERKLAQKLVKKCFSEGFVPRNTDKRNRQWDFVLFQEYLPEVEERRMIRIGDSYLAIDKVKKGDFHSGSGKMKWAVPGREFLDLTRQITDTGGFRSMNVDFFLAQDGRTLINELHSLFHGPAIDDEAGMGRYIYNTEQNNWDFEAGGYYRNYCCNLRIIDLLKQIGVNEDVNMDWVKLPPFEYAGPPEIIH